MGDQPDKKASSEPWHLAEFDPLQFDALSLNLLSEEDMPSAFFRTAEFNRYLDVLPSATHRVVLRNNGSRDYINASNLVVEGVDQHYIAATGPLPTTVVEFWHMIWQTPTLCIVMLSGFMEKGKGCCAMYFPTSPGQTMQVDKYTIQNVRQETFGIVTRSLLHVHDGSNVRTCYHFWVRAWAGETSPQPTPDQLLDLVELVESCKHDLAVDNLGQYCEGEASINRSDTYASVRHHDMADASSPNRAGPTVGAGQTAIARPGSRHSDGGSDSDMSDDYEFVGPDETEPSNDLFTTHASKVTFHPDLVSSDSEDENSPAIEELYATVNRSNISRQSTASPEQPPPLPERRVVSPAREGDVPAVVAAEAEPHYKQPRNESVSAARPVSIVDGGEEFGFRTRLSSSCPNIHAASTDNNITATQPKTATDPATGAENGAMATVSEGTDVHEQTDSGSVEIAAEPEPLYDNHHEAFLDDEEHSFYENEGSPPRLGMGSKKAQSVPDLSTLRKVSAAAAPAFPPVLVHCGSGVGRTGTFIAADVCCKMLQKSGSCDPCQVIAMLRQCRSGMVQSPAQYQLVYQTCIRYAARQEKLLSFGDQKLHTAEYSVSDAALPVEYMTFRFDEGELLATERARQQRVRRASLAGKNHSHEQQPWFHGRLDRQHAEQAIAAAVKALTKMPADGGGIDPSEDAPVRPSFVIRSTKLPDGAFLVRESPSAKGQFAVSIYAKGQVVHHRIMTHGGRFCTEDGNDHGSLVELVEHHHKHPGCFNILLTEAIYSKEAMETERSLAQMQVSSDDLELLASSTASPRGSAAQSLSISKAGWVYKQSSGSGRLGRKAWNKRWLVLQDTMLKYYRVKSEPHLPACGRFGPVAVC